MQKFLGRITFSDASNKTKEKHRKVEFLKNVHVGLRLRLIRADKRRCNHGMIDKSRKIARLMMMVNRSINGNDKQLAKR